MTELKELTVQYGRQKSYYKRAHVYTLEDGREVLRSYDTDVAVYKRGQGVTLTAGIWAYSNTTKKHLNEFLQQCGYSTIGIADIRKALEGDGRI